MRQGWPLRGGATLSRCGSVPEHHDAADTIARWLEEHTGREVHLEKVEPGDEQVLPEREQRELDALPPRLAD